MKERLGVLVHGAGWVSGQHLAAWKANPYADVVAVSSRSSASARRRVAEAGLEGVSVHDDFEEALGVEGVDVVSICTPQHVHCENVLTAAAAGKHMVIEKPVGMTLDELRAMREAVRKAGVKTISSFVLRFNPLFQTLKGMIADDAFGDVYHVEVDYYSHNASWWPGWEEGRRKDLGGSALLVAGCHAIDAVRWFAGRGEFEAAPVEEVYALSGGFRKGSDVEYDCFTHQWHRDRSPLEYDGLEMILVKLAGGVLGKVAVDFDCIMPYRLPLRILGSRGTAFDNRFFSHKLKGQRDWAEIPTILPDSSDVTHHPFQAQIDHFVDCIQRDVESHCNLEDAIKTCEVALAALECYRTRRPVALPLLD